MSDDELLAQVQQLIIRCTSSSFYQQLNAPLKTFELLALFLYLNFDYEVTFLPYELNLKPPLEESEYKHFSHSYKEFLQLLEPSTIGHPMPAMKFIATLAQLKLALHDSSSTKPQFIYHAFAKVQLTRGNLCIEDNKFLHGGLSLWSDDPSVAIGRLGPAKKGTILRLPLASKVAKMNIGSFAARVDWLCLYPKEHLYLLPSEFFFAVHEKAAVEGELTLLDIVEVADK